MAQAGMNETSRNAMPSAPNVIEEEITFVHPPTHIFEGCTEGTERCRCQDNGQQDAATCRCEDSYRVSVNKTCIHNCYDHGNWLQDYERCACFIGWTGPSCQTDINECEAEETPCNNHAKICINSAPGFYCHCFSEYAGETCDVPTGHKDKHGAGMATAVFTSIGLLFLIGAIAQLLYALHTRGKLRDMPQRCGKMKNKMLGKKISARSKKKGSNTTNTTNSDKQQRQSRL